MSTLNNVLSHPCAFQLASIEQSNTVLPKPEELVKRMAAQERQQFVIKRKEITEFFASKTLEFEEDANSYWEKKKKSYLEMENSIRDNPEKIPRWEVAGPLNYSMTLSTMKNVIESKFKEMVSSGQMISEKSYCQQQYRKDFYCNGDNNLTRIWGADFLKTNLVNTPSLKAADHFLIVKDGATELEVTVWHSISPYFPSLQVVQNAYIVSKKIEGHKRTTKDNISFYGSSRILDQLQYRDFNYGNIIQDSNGVGWIVDTEEKSFEAPVIKGDALTRQVYLKDRFRVLSGKEYSSVCQIFKISLSGMGLFL